MNLSNLKEILDAREARAVRQQELLSLYRDSRQQSAGKPVADSSVLISYSLNIPGPVKNAELYCTVFDIGLHKIRKTIDEHLVTGESAGSSASETRTVTEERGDSAAGPFAFFLIHTDKAMDKDDAENAPEDDPGNVPEDAPGDIPEDAFEGVSGHLQEEPERLRIKKLMAQLEENDPLGRLWDIDILVSGPEGPVKVSRSEVGYPKRQCLVCDAPAFVCVRAARHKVPEVLMQVVDRVLDSEESRSIILQGIKCGSAADSAERALSAPGTDEGGHSVTGASKSTGLAMNALPEAAAEKIAIEALRAILYEVITTPKPGLVDAENNGAHKDMDITTFFDSAAAIAPYFLECALEGIRRREEEPESFLLYLRPLGIRAEENMYRATGGVNTHKGAVFTMGVLCAAAGWNSAHSPACGGVSAAAAAASVPKAVKNIVAGAGGQTQAESILHIAGRICSAMGNGSRGIRNEAMNGYPSVREALIELRPVHDEGSRERESREKPVTSEVENVPEKRNISGVRALLRLMSRVDDTNIIRRSGEEAAGKIRYRAAEILKNVHGNEELSAAASRLDAELIRENISPGGSADLLAAAYFLDALANRKL